MAFVHETTRGTVELRRVFAGMDAGDDAVAVRAMNEAAAILRKQDLSFRQIVQRAEAHELLLPSKVAAAIQLMDSTTLSEAQSALAGARRLMKSCGLTFERIIAALEHQPPGVDEIERLRRAYQFEMEKSREMAEELQILRENAAPSELHRFGAPLKSIVVVATMLFGLWLAVSVVETITGPFRSTTVTAAPSRATTVVQRVDVEPASAPSPPAMSNCWRDRSIKGRCF